jgi:hypothetical protein
MALTNLKAPAVTGNLAADIKTDTDNLGLTLPAGQGGTSGSSNPIETGFHSLLQQIYDKIKADGEVIIADMQKAQAIAATKLPDGSAADQPSADCLAAFLPVVQLIVENQLVLAGVTPAASTPGATPVPATPDGVVTAFVKMRVVVNALTSPSVQKGCSWLQQSIQQAGTQGLASVLGGVLGIGKLVPLLGIA